VFVKNVAKMTRDDLYTDSRVVNYTHMTKILLWRSRWLH